MAILAVVGFCLVLSATFDLRSDSQAWMVMLISLLIVFFIKKPISMSLRKKYKNMTDETWATIPAMALAVTVAARLFTFLPLATALMVPCCALFPIKMPLVRSVVLLISIISTTLLVFVLAAYHQFKYDEEDIPAAKNQSSTLLLLRTAHNHNNVTAHPNHHNDDDAATANMYHYVRIILATDLMMPKGEGILFSALLMITLFCGLLANPSHNFYDDYYYGYTIIGILPAILLWFLPQTASSSVTNNHHPGLFALVVGTTLGLCAVKDESLEVLLLLIHSSTPFFPQTT